MNESDLMNLAPLDRRAAAQLGALELAYVGDCVFELTVRTRLLRETGKKVKELHGQVVAHVCAAAITATRGFPKAAARPNTRWRRRSRRCLDFSTSAARHRESAS